MHFSTWLWMHSLCLCFFSPLDCTRSIQYSESRRTKKQTWVSLQKQLITQLSYHPMHMHSVYTMHVYRSSFRQFIENRSDLSCKSAKSTYATIRTSSHSQFYLSFLLIIEQASAHILLFLRNERKNIRDSVNQSTDYHLVWKVRSGYTFLMRGEYIVFISKSTVFIVASKSFEVC